MFEWTLMSWDIIGEMKIIPEAQTIYRKIMKMDSHPMIWITFQLCLVMHSQLVQAIVGSNFHHQCPDQCLCLSQIQVSKRHIFKFLSKKFIILKNLLMILTIIQHCDRKLILFQVILYWIHNHTNNWILVARIRKCSQYSTIWIKLFNYLESLSHIS